MKIINRSDFSTEHLLAFVNRVAATELDSGSTNYVLIIESRSSKAERTSPSVRWHRSGGASYAKLILPCDMSKFLRTAARYIAWSMAIFRGLKNKQMGDRYKSTPVAAAHWAWALTMPLERKQGKAPTTVEQKRFKELQVAEKAVTTWERKQKLATTKLKIWKRRVAILNKRMEDSKQLAHQVVDQDPEAMKSIALESTRRMPVTL